MAGTDLTVFLSFKSRLSSHKRCKKVRTPIIPTLFCRRKARQGEIVPSFISRPIALTLLQVIKIHFAYPLSYKCKEGNERTITPTLFYKLR